MTQKNAQKNQSPKDNQCSLKTKQQQGTKKKTTIKISFERNGYGNTT